MKIYSFFDKKSKLYVDCCECKRGYKGEKNCSGSQHKRKNQGGCFIGKLLESIPINKVPYPYGKIK